MYVFMCVCLISKHSSLLKNKNKRKVLGDMADSKTEATKNSRLVQKKWYQIVGKYSENDGHIPKRQRSHLEGDSYCID